MLIDAIRRNIMIKIKEPEISKDVISKSKSISMRWLFGCALVGAVLGVGVFK